jgi:hypothetical protein
MSPSEPRPRPMARQVCSRIVVQPMYIQKHNRKSCNCRTKQHFDIRSAVGCSVPACRAHQCMAVVIRAVLVDFDVVRDCEMTLPPPRCSAMCNGFFEGSGRCQTSYRLIKQQPNEREQKARMLIPSPFLRVFVRILLDTRRRCLTARYISACSQTTALGVQRHTCHSGSSG